MKHVTQWILVALSTIGCANLSQADQIFTTPAGAINPLTGESVSAEADFSLSANTLTLKLINTYTGIHSAGQLLTGLFFTTSSGTATLTSQTGDLVKLGSGGTITDLGVSNLGWGFGTANNEFELCVICQGGVTASATPSEGILGPVSGDGKYDNANASLLTASHNPLVENFATFKFTVDPGVTVGNVSFWFGTTPGTSVAEPSCLSMLGLGLFAVVALSRRKR